MLLYKTKIKPICTHTGVLPAYPSEHVLFAVTNGADKLRVVQYKTEKKSTPYDENYSLSLHLGDTPLIRIQSSGCPTCESLLAAGYGLPEDNPELRSARAELERQYAGLDDALKRLRPILGLLRSGVYVLTYSMYYPTDGDGHFFWDVPADFVPFKATAEYYDIDSMSVLPSFPCYLYPTQGAEKYDPSQVDYYRKRLHGGESLAPVLAYSLWGYMSVLLDGHHRASACALEGCQVPCLTIARPGEIWRDRVPHIVWPDGSETPVADILTADQQNLLNNYYRAGEIDAPPPQPAASTQFKRAWELEYVSASRRYPTCYDAGALALYPGLELTAEGIRKLAMDDDYEDVSSAARLLRYAARQPGADCKGLGMAFIERGYPPLLRQTAFEILDGIKDDQEIDDLMIQVLVDCERKDDPIYKIANGHWEEDEQRAD